MPKKIYEAEKVFLDEANKVKELRNELADIEAELYKSGKIKGTSDKVRTMQMTPHVKDKQFEIQRAEFMADLAKIERNRRQNEFDAYKIIAQLLAPTPK
jgi:hypothetical protein